MTHNPVAVAVLLVGLVVGGPYLWNHLYLKWTARGIREPLKSYERQEV